MNLNRRQASNAIFTINEKGMYCTMQEASHAMLFHPTSNLEPLIM
jgi:hypothetical protein